MGTKQRVKQKQKIRAGRSRKGRKKHAGQFTPSKGGDGGRAVSAKRGPDWDANARVVLTGASISRRTPERAAFEAGLIATTDTADRAHNQKKLAYDGANPQHSENWVIKGLGEIDIPGSDAVSTPRMYHTSQVVGRVEIDEDGRVVFDNRVGVDSMYDAIAEEAQRLEGAGIEMGWHTGRPGECSRTEQALRLRFEGADHHDIRDVINQRTRQKPITREEIGDG